MAWGSCVVEGRQRDLTAAPGAAAGSAHGAPALRLLLRGAQPQHLDDRSSLPQQTTTQIGDGRPAVQRRTTAGAVPAARPQRRRHDLAAPHVDRAVRRPARPRRRHAAGAPQLLHRRGVRRALLDVPLRGAARARRLVLPRLGPAGGHVRRRPVHGRLRRVEVGAAPAGPVRRGGEPVGRRGRRRAAHRRERPRTRACSSASSATGTPAGTPDDLCGCSARPTPPPCRRSTSAAAPRTSCSTTTCASSTPARPRASR